MIPPPLTTISIYPTGYTILTYPPQLPPYLFPLPRRTFLSLSDHLMPQTKAYSPTNYPSASPASSLEIMHSFEPSRVDSISSKKVSAVTPTWASQLGMHRDRITFAIRPLVLLFDALPSLH
ncbi:hypothetical protein ARMSODRAFT_1023028 [Armillaria solidipes]|uniref:Uncharacterized protein n=1 Tax=Armillaria solidipes TaxID=1076256 RepID=A0A2H3BEF2_9AGAR|nr:hypothetical protein ARMSODRAFT_1023028 [Armillaria solidipes]